MAEHLTLVAYSPERPFDKLKCVEHKNKAGRESFSGIRDRLSKALAALGTKLHPIHAAEPLSDRVLDNRRNRSNSNSDGTKRCS